MDENSKHGGGDAGSHKSTAENAATQNPITAPNVVAAAASADAAVVATESEAVRAARTPFTNLSQVDADLALARTLQEQERAYMMLRVNGNGSNYGSWEEEYYFDDDDDEGDSYDDDEYDGVDEDQDDNNEGVGLDENTETDDNTEDEEDDDDDDDEGDDDASDMHGSAHSEENEASSEVDPADFPDDESYARALQDAEERDMAARMLAMAGITEREVEELEEHGGNSQEAWEEVDPDELSYEELIALGEVVGTESRGLSADTIASLPSINYKSETVQEEEPGTCVICRLEYEDGDTLTLLNCKHPYHSECISSWLKINKVCPVCSTEVSTSGKSS